MYVRHHETLAVTGVEQYRHLGLNCMLGHIQAGKNAYKNLFTLDFFFLELAMPTERSRPKCQELEAGSRSRPTQHSDPCSGSYSAPAQHSLCLHQLYANYITVIARTGS